MEHNYLQANILLHDLQRWCKYTFTYPSLLQEYSYLHKQVRSHDTVSKVAYVSNFTKVSECVHVNGAYDVRYCNSVTLKMGGGGGLPQNYRCNSAIIKPL